MEKEKSFEVKAGERQSWLSLAMIWTGSMICIPCLMIGGVLGMAFTLPQVILCTLIGYGIVCIYMCFMGMQGCDTGMPTVSMASSVLGVKGGQFVVSLLLAVSCVGWFGIQSAVCGASFSSMLGSMAGVNIPVPVSSIFWGIIMLLTAVYGYKGLKILNYIAVPALIIVLAYGIFVAFARYDGVNLIASWIPSSQMSLVSGISMVVGSFALGGVISGDYSRYAKSRTDVIKSNVLGVFPSGLVVIMIGASLTMVTKQYDISAVLTALGVPALGLLALVLATWTTNVTNAYSGGIAVSSLLGKGEKSFKLSTAVSGALGTILAAVGLLNYFQGFLSVLTALIPPVAGVIIAEYWIIGKGRAGSRKVEEDWNIGGMIAFVAGAIVAYVTGNVYPVLIGPVNGIIVSMVLHVVFERFRLFQPVSVSGGGNR